MKFKNILLSCVSVFLFAFVVGVIQLQASSNSSTFEFLGTNIVTEGSEFELELQLVDIVGDPVAGLSGRLKYDTEYLELMTVDCLNSSFIVSFNNKTNKFTGITFTNDRLNEDTTLMTLKFKAKKVGDTVVTIIEPDASTGQRYTPNVVDKNISIVF